MKHVTLRWVKTLLALILFGAVCFIAWPAFAQTSASAEITLDWMNPVLNTDGTAVPATGDDSLARAKIWIDSVAIPAAPVKNPIEVSYITGGVVQKFTTTVQLPAGGTAFIRMSVCNLGGTCSGLSDMITRVIPVIHTPGKPTSVTFTIRIVPTTPGP